MIGGGVPLLGMDITQVKKALSRGQFLRLFFGVFLVVSSIVATGLVIRGDQETELVAVAQAPIPAGMQISVEGVEYVKVPLAPPFAGFLSKEELASKLSLVTRNFVPAGAFLTDEALVEATSLDESIITLSLNLGSPSWLVSGARAQLWVAAPLSESSFSSPFVLSNEVVIDRVTFDDGFAADGQVSHVDIRIVNRDIPGAIYALANGYFLYLTPIGDLQ